MREGVRVSIRSSFRPEAYSVTIGRFRFTENECVNKLVPIRARVFAEKSVIRSKSDRFAAFRLFLELHLIFKKRRGLSGCRFRKIPFKLVSLYVTQNKRSTETGRD